MTVQTLAELRRFAGALDCTREIPLHQTDLWLGAFAQVVDPTYDVALITLVGGGGGSSRRPGHIVLNWRRRFDVVPDVGIASAGGIAVESPFLRALFGLYIWNKIWRGADEELTLDEASIIETLWLGGARKTKVGADDAYLAVTDARAAAGLDPLARPAFERGLERLASMKCIELTGDEIWLREWVRRRT